MPDIDGVELVEGGSGKREVGDAVDLPWQAARGLEQGLDRGRLEQRQFAAGQVQPVQPGRAQVRRGADRRGGVA